MTKCDFCDKEAVGHTAYNCISYCDDHYAQAKEDADKMYRAMEAWDEYKEDKYFHGDGND